MKEEIPNQIKKSLKRWKTQSAMLQYFYAIFGVISIISLLIVTSFTDLLGDLLTRIVSFCGALAILLIAGFRLSWHANKMRRSYVELRSAIIKYETISDFTLSDLTREYTCISSKISSIMGPQVEPLKSDIED
ncbi:MAG: hypothetical protein WC854_11860 [Bacteroidales bacterium]